jgi:hypothetical protein
MSKDFNLIMENWRKFSGTKKYLRICVFLKCSVILLSSMNYISPKIRIFRL